LIIQPLRSFCRRNIDSTTIGWGGLLPGKSIADVLADAYDEHLFDGVLLEDMPDKPQFIFKATNLQTGRMVRMSKRRIADYRIGEIPHPKGFRLATAVAASSAFPPVLSPVVIKTKPSDWKKLEGADLHGQSAFTKKLVLTDGGVYDNIGLESIDSFQTILVSDAGAPFAFQMKKETFWPKQVFRALDIATDQSRGLRKRLLINQATMGKQTAAYWGIDQDGMKAPPHNALPAPISVTEKLARIRTRLNKFSPNEQGQLINWGYASCDNAVRRFADPAAAPPDGWPVPKHALG
jgi:NTE family protein